mgnify:CR=1 FL=1
MEFCVREGSGSGRCTPWEHQGDSAHRDTSCSLPDARDPLRVAATLGRSQLWPLGLHIQLCEDIPESSGSSPSGSRARGYDPTLHEELQRSPHPNVPQAGCACHGRNGKGFGMPQYHQGVCDMCS